MNLAAHFVQYCYNCNSLIKANMVFNSEERAAKRKVLSQLDDFDRNGNIGNAANTNSGKLIVVVNEATVDQDFTVNDSGSISTTNENAVNV